MHNGLWGTQWTVEKWTDEQCEEVRAAVLHRPWRYGWPGWRLKYLSLYGYQGVGSDLLRRYYEPDSTVVIPGNLALNAGIAEMLTLLIGTGGTAFSAANARTWVGDSTTAEAATQTAIVAATNKLSKGMNATYPSISAQTLSFQSDFVAGEAQWGTGIQEIVIDNGGTGLKALNRKVQNLGVKSGGTWTVTTTMTPS